MRAVAGMQLGGEIISYLSSIISSSGASKFGIQFGSYATFMSFFGLADLQAASENFTGVVDYASSMAFELFTTADVEEGTFPAEDDLSVRFLFHNGTASNGSEPAVYPLFGADATSVSWNEFKDKVGRFAITETKQWCEKCGNTAGSCAAYADSDDGAAATQQNGGGDGGISPAIGGVIGAFVTLAVVLGSLALLMLLGGFRLVSKKALKGDAAAGAAEPKA